MTMVGVWLMVLALATTVTWQIVSAADEQVSERPIAPLNIAAPVLTALQPTTSTIPSESTTTRAVTSPSTTSPPSISSTTEPTSTTPTTSEAPWQTKSVSTTGGTVLLRYRAGEVAYQSATPAPGFHVEVEKKGPPEVKVEFESETHKVEIEASWSDGQLKVKVSDEDGD